MYPKQHLIINFLVSLPFLFLINPIYALIIFFSSVLIDVDHYLYYVSQEKKIFLLKAYKWYMIKDAKWRLLSTKERKKHSRSILIFHGAEQIILLSLFSIIYYPLIFITLGFLIHLIEDLIEDIPLGVAKRKFSLIYSIYYYNKLNKTSNKK